MSLRLRLALWYGGLTGVVVLFVSIFTYAAHTRGHYDDLDYTLRGTTEHAAQEYVTLWSQQGTPKVSAPISQTMAFRVYDTDGTVLSTSPGAEEAPEADPRAVLAHPVAAAFDPVAGLSPPMVSMGSSPSSGAFGLVADAAGTRWRVFVLPLHSGSTTRFMESLVSLDRIDASVAAFRQLVVVLALGGAIVAFVAGWLLAARALRPVATLTETARAVAHSRGFNRRVPVPGGARGDELGQLATTFNEMLDSLEQAYKAQQRFVSDASHELRAPLTAIQGNLELLERMPDMPGAERQEAVSEASREAHRLSRLVADLLALARADAGVPLRKERVELDRVVMDSLSDARHLARGQRLEVEQLEPAMVEGDPDRLKQLVLIFLDNAIKYTPPDGLVTLALRRNGQRVEVLVHDTGIGIPPEDLSRVFDRFYRADPARTRDPGGTGLGLSIARWVVEQHGGEIALESEPGRGTTARIYLPLAP